MLKPWRRNCYWVALIGCALGVTLPASAQLGEGLRAAGKLIKKDKNEENEKSDKGAEKKTDEKTTEKTSGNPRANRAEKKAGAAVLFSKSPIDPAKPENPASSFKAGDNIYGLIQTEKTWRDLLGKGNEDVKEIQVPVDMIVDGKDTDFQYITIKNAKAIDSKFLVLDIAPDPAKMTAYKDEGFSYGEGKGNRKIGPDQYTYNLSKLKPGKHTIKYQVRSYGDIFSAGEFTIEGDDYKPYEALREKVLKEALNVGGMPASQKTDVKLQAEMIKLLQNGGWKNIRKLVIVDKDWWISYVDGSDSAIKSRHINAAAAAKADDGTYYWSNVMFEQMRLADGSYGTLELVKTGIKRPIKEENIDK